MLTRSGLSVMMIVLFNLVPVIGVAFYNWSPFQMFWLFWMETLIISLFNGVRVLMSQGNAPEAKLRSGSLSYNVFPAIKYLLMRVFIFMFYSVFIIVFIGFLSQTEKEPVGVVKTIAFQNVLFNMALAITILSQTIFLVKHFFANGAYLYSRPGDYSGIFDGRQIIMHIAIVLGAVGAMFIFKNSGNNTLASVWIVSVLCVLKCLAELFFLKKDLVRQATSVNTITSGVV